jgi:energy-coupling factor transporter ATP-binding protein EcfA2
MALTESELVAAVANLSERQPGGLTVLVVGPMGSGKTTLLRLLTFRLKLRPAKESTTRRLLQQSDRTLFSCIAGTLTPTELAATELLLSRCGVSSVSTWLTVRQPASGGAPRLTRSRLAAVLAPLRRRAGAGVDRGDAPRRLPGD